jgi:hypothetical protein
MKITIMFLTASKIIKFLYFLIAVSKTEPIFSISIADISRHAKTAKVDAIDIIRAKQCLKVECWV